MNFLERNPGPLLITNTGLIQMLTCLAPSGYCILFTPGMLSPEQSERKLLHHCGLCLLSHSHTYTHSSNDMSQSVFLCYHSCHPQPFEATEELPSDAQINDVRSPRPLRNHGKEELLVANSCWGVLVCGPECPTCDSVAAHTRKKCMLIISKSFPHGETQAAGSWQMLRDMSSCFHNEECNFLSTHLQCVLLCSNWQVWMSSTENGIDLVVRCTTTHFSV